MIKLKVLQVLFFLFLVTGTPLIALGNAITKEYCQNLLDSALNEYSKKNYAKSIELFIKTKNFAETNNYTKIKISALNTLGAIFHDISDYKKAMDYYLEAYSLVLNEPNMKSEESKILNNIAGLYVTDKKYDVAADYFQKALLINKQIKDTTTMITIFNNLGVIANQVNNMDLAIKYADSALKLSQGVPTIQMFDAQLIKIQALSQKKEYSTAEKLALETFRQAQVDEIDYRNMVSLILLVAEIYQEQGKGQQALSFVQQALDYSSGLRDIIEVYKQMAILYQKNQLPDLALAYKDSVIVLKDSLHKINAFNDTENSRIQIELLNSEKELSESKTKQKAERILFTVVLIAIFVLAVVFIWILRIQSARNKQRKQIAELELEQEKSQNLLQQEQLNNEIETKNRQLTAQVLSQSNKKDIINEIIHTLSSFPAQSKVPELNSIIFTLKRQAKESEHWNDFLIHFEQINPSFISILKEKHPDLSNNDIRFLSYIYLNLDSKKISDLLNISFDSLRKKKLRLANKMGIESVDIYTYLINISGS